MRGVLWKVGEILSWIDLSLILFLLFNIRAIWDELFNVLRFFSMFF